MAPHVYKVTYECVGPGAEIAAEHYAAVKAAQSAALAAAREYGGVGYRPKFDGAFWTILFGGKDVPRGFRAVRLDGRGNTEAVPNLSTKIGKAATKALAALPKMPLDRDLADRFGFSNQPFDGTAIYSAVAVRVEHPTVRTFLRLPRTEGDGWPGHPGLVEVSEGEMMRALEAHNAAARAQQHAAE